MGKSETLTSGCLNEIFCQLSVENAMANSAAETNEKIEAKHKVTALQKAILKKRKQTADSNGSFFQAGCMIISRIFSIHPMFQKSGD